MITPFEFPNAATLGYKKTSEIDWSYNCIAWAAEGDQDRWWWPFGKDPIGNEAYWPDGISRDGSLKAMTALFKRQGYKISTGDKGDLEANVEKVVIYALNNRPTHAARQLVTGVWTHKIGGCIDLEAPELEAFEGPVYGQVVRYMKRKRET